MFLSTQTCTPKCSASTPGLFLVLFPGCALIANKCNNYVLDGFDVTSFEHLQLTWHMLRAIVGENVVVHLICFVNCFGHN